MKDKRWFSKLLLCVLVAAAGFACQKPLTLSEQASRRRAAEALLAQAVLEMRKGDLNRAEARLELALELRPFDARLSDGLGCVAWRRKRFTRAKRYFEQAVKIDPFYDRGYAHLALDAEREGRFREAERLYEQAISLTPLNPRSRNNYAALLAERHQDLKSYSELLKAQALASKDERPVIDANVRALRRKLRLFDRAP